MTQGLPRPPRWQPAGLGQRRIQTGATERQEEESSRRAGPFLPWVGRGASHRLALFAQSARQALAPARRRSIDWAEAFPLAERLPSAGFSADEVGTREIPIPRPQRA